MFLRRGGEFFKIGSGLPQGKALKLGEGEAKRTLAATFKLVPKGFTQQKDIDFRVGEEFRNFQIRQGKRVETPLQFIQKSEFRLSSQTERSEISKFRKLRIGA